MSLLLFASLMAFTSCDLLQPDKSVEPDESAGEIYDYSDPEKSGVDVVDYDMGGGYMAITTTEDKAPKMGDFLCSGSTEKAPLGYLLKVVDIERVDPSIVSEYNTKSGTKVGTDGEDTYLVTTAQATLDEILRSRGEEAQGWLSVSNGKVKLSEDATRAGIEYKPKDEGLFTILDVSQTFEVEGDTKKDDDHNDKNLVKWENYGDGNLEIKISEYLSLNDYCVYTDPANENRSGFKIQFYNHFNVHFSGSLGVHKECDDLITWGINKLKPVENKANVKKYKLSWYPVIPLEVVGVPINITLKVDLRFPFEANLKAGIDADLMDRKNYWSVGAMFDTDKVSLSPLDESGDRYCFTEEYPEGSEAAEKADSENSKFGLYLKGDFKVGPKVELSAGINGTNLTSEELDYLISILKGDDEKEGLLDIILKKKESNEENKEKLISLKAEVLTFAADASFDFGVGVKMGIEYVTENPLMDLLSSNPNKNYGWQSSDKWSMTGDFNANVIFTLLDLKLGFKGFDIATVKLKKEFPFNWPLFKFEGPFLFPDYTEQKVNATPGEFIKISAKKTDSFATWFYGQKGFGYVLEKFGSDDIRYFDAPESLDMQEEGNLFSKKYRFTMTLPIKASELNQNVPYTLYPYTIISKPFHMPYTEFKVFRKGVKFIYNGTELVYNTIDEVYGEVL